MFKKKSQIKKFTKSFKERVLEIVKQIPKGKVLSYGEVSKRAGVPTAGRAVGSIMSQNSDKSIPCHRVVLASGKIGNYNGLRTKSSGTNAKINLLTKEGVKFTKTNKIIL